MDRGTLYSIGELARRTGLTVKAIRRYSDLGIVVPACRTDAGYRRYTADAVARLALVRTLRELGFGLGVIRQVADRERTLGEVAAEHAAALDAQLHLLRLRRAVLTIAAKREPTTEEMELVHHLATLSETERRRLIEDFLDAVLDPELAGVRRTLTPELPDDPTEEQLRAWVELAELSLDPEFRAALRRLVAEHEVSVPPRPDAVALTRELAGPAVASGIAPDSPRADAVVTAITGRCSLGPAELAHRLEAANDPRRDRYVRLLAVINQWAPPEDLAPVLDWSVTALRLRAA
ncbi:MerR family transcriptional regulator [Amycolatopsis sp. 195334CR]|uniref:MerR family transcriptional regulator n=1 Tax=Amycolatopsis sp. 195334CR TaxID=2814588 RepID=UPI001A8ECA2F|nr:MerR family transcriptional regulator [Amycolatopsis sp. 195334CR]MBN6041125.1 MerR family transcriptional regulator [Amycolatopsis sp. 195334CR]